MTALSKHLHFPHKNFIILVLLCIGKILLHHRDEASYVNVGEILIASLIANPLHALTWIMKLLSRIRCLLIRAYWYLSSVSTLMN